MRPAARGRHGGRRRLLSRGLLRGDDGNAVTEFVFVAVLLMVPLVYLVVAVAVAQRSSLAVTQAAREAGRAYATADNPEQGRRRAQVAVRLALADAGIDTPDATLTVVAPNAGCGDTEVAAVTTPGAEYVVCVTRQVDLPGVPAVLEGRGVTTVGRFVVHVDDYRGAG